LHRNISATTLALQTAISPLDSPQCVLSNGVNGAAVQQNPKNG
jgi:hypothetical protein